jgi:hypothetical protein
MPVSDVCHHVLHAVCLPRSRSRLASKLLQAESEAAKLAAVLAELEGLAHASHGRVLQLEAQVEAQCTATIGDVQRHEAAMDALQQVSCKSAGHLKLLPFADQRLG